jgi:hypothetical protein
MSLAEYPPETPGLDGTGLTEAVCPKHGVKRTVSADALFVKGAPMGTFGLKCLIALDAKAEKAKKTAGVGSPVRTGETSANGTVYSSNAPADATLCQEALVPSESYDENGVQVRKGGKAIERKDREAPPATGGEKLSRASSPKAAKAAKNTAAKRNTKIDSRGGKGVTVKDED